jgi:hypothetical protein
MDNTKQDFEKRKAEIDNYFRLLIVFDDDDTRLHYKNEERIIVEERIQPQAQVILIANAFLILYNLIESTVRNSIIDIYARIKDDGVRYEDLTENLKKIWIKKITDNLKEANYRSDTLRDRIFTLAEKILKRETILLSNEYIDFAGNIDARKIRELADTIGFDTSSNGRNLKEIKNKRNRLAHGEQTFYEVGKDFSVKQLSEFKDETFKYLSDVIEKIEKFITDKKYQCR